MDKAMNYVDSLVGSACKSQGGAVRDAGPTSATDPKASGDAETVSSVHKAVDQDRTGTAKNPFHEV